MFYRDETSALSVQTNEVDNRVIAFRRHADGTLVQREVYPTGGAGDAKAHLASQGSVMVTGDRRRVMVANAASDDVTTFGARRDGGLERIATTPTGGGRVSVAEHHGLVYVLSTAKGAVSGFRMTDTGPAPIAGSEHGLSTDEADPAQVGFTADGSVLIVTERATDSIITFPVRLDGSLGRPEVAASSGPMPYGFALTAGGTLVVTEAFRAQKARRPPLPTPSAAPICRRSPPR